MLTQESQAHSIFRGHQLVHSLMGSRRWVVLKMVARGTSPRPGKQRDAGTWPHLAAISAVLSCAVWAPDPTVQYLWCRASLAEAVRLAALSMCGLSVHDQGSNPHPWHWEAGSQPVDHRVSPKSFFLNPLSSKGISMAQRSHCISFLVIEPSPALPTPLHSRALARGC